jgi:hypothetical protein
MKKSLAVWAGFASVLGLISILHAQEAAMPVQGGAVSQDVNSMSDTEVLLQTIESVPPAPAASASRVGTFYSAQHAPGTRLAWPPLPGNDGLPVWNLGDGVYLLDDLQVDYSLPVSSRMAGGMRMEADGMAPPGGSGGTNDFYSDSFNFNPTNYGTNLWLELSGITNRQVYLTAHNVVTGFFQLLFKTNLLDNGWTVDPDNDNAVNAVTELPLWETVGSPVPELDPGATNSQMFFWARQSDVEVDVTGSLDSGEVLRPSPGFNGTSGIFMITRSYWPDDDPAINSNLVVHFSMSGTATNGVDYVLKDQSSEGIITNSIIIQAGQEQAFIELDPTTNLLCLSNLIATLTLEDGTNYLVQSQGSADSITIDFNDFCLVSTADNLPGPCGIDYSPFTNSLIVSSENGSGTWSFKRIDTNGVVNNWSSLQITGPDEVKLATVKTTANGFTNGAMYFDSSGSGTIGRLSPDGSVYTPNFFTTSGVYQFWGLYIDQSGCFGGNLIALLGGGSVWRINSSGAAVTNYPGAAGGWVEGLVSIVNNTNQYGPLAGKIFTGGDTVDTNGNVVPLALNIVAEDCDIIQSNQNLYCADPVDGGGWVLEVPKELFAGHAGDVLVTQNGVYGSATLFMVHWDAANGLVTTRIPTPKYVTQFEHVTFAPMDIPAVSPPVSP